MMTDSTSIDKRGRFGDTDVVGARALAQIIDAVLSILLFAIVGRGVELVLAGPTAAQAAPLMTLLAVGPSAMVLAGIVAGLYPVVFEWRWNGQTGGKRLVGIRVLSRNGGAINFGGALSRNVFAFVDGAFFYLVGLAAMATSADRERMGDRIAGTVVVRPR